MIISFQCKETEKIWNGDLSRRLPKNIQEVSLRKLRFLDAAKCLEDLRIPPSNKLEALKGDRKGFHSMRVNNQWRVCFMWDEGDAMAVEIVDYH